MGKVKALHMSLTEDDMHFNCAGDDLAHFIENIMGFELTDTQRENIELANCTHPMPPEPPTTPPVCFCGSECVYKDSKGLYAKSYGMRWICKRFPACRGSVGAHPDGKPLGSVPDEPTKKLRGQLHSIVDAVWSHKRTGRERHQARGSAYRWLSDITGWPIDICHIGMMNERQCLYALERTKTIPYEKRKELLPRRT